MTTQLRHTIRTARTRKTCHDCGLPIRPGDRYADIACASERRVYTWPSHAECHDELTRLDGLPEFRAEDGYPYASLTEYFERDDLSPSYRAWLEARQ